MKGATDVYLIFGFFKSKYFWSNIELSFFIVKKVAKSTKRFPQRLKQNVNF